MGIDTGEVMEAAGTKWNFLKFKPGLVGGHCIGVDPYYLAHKAERLGYFPQVILSGRRVNDGMGAFVANKVVKLMIEHDIKIKGAKALLLGITFKENCPDIRNTKVVDIYSELRLYSVDVDVYDPRANLDEVYEEYGIQLVNAPINNKYDAIVLAVSHSEFLNLNYSELKKSENAIIFDIKGVIDRKLVDGRL
jgi:UDP-N-acetyl-D-galactosamine dehydrogenase